MTAESAAAVIARRAFHWRRVDATELWLFRAGTALTLKTAEHDPGPITATRLGPLAGTRQSTWSRAANGRRRKPARTAGRRWRGLWRREPSPYCPMAVL